MGKTDRRWEYLSEALLKLTLIKPINVNYCRGLAADTTTILCWWPTCSSASSCAGWWCVANKSAEVSAATDWAGPIWFIVVAGNLNGKWRRLTSSLFPVGVSEVYRNIIYYHILRTGWFIDSHMNIKGLHSACLSRCLSQVLGWLNNE